MEILSADVRESGRISPCSALEIGWPPDSRNHPRRGRQLVGQDSRYRYSEVSRNNANQGFGHLGLTSVNARGRPRPTCALLLGLRVVGIVESESLHRSQPFMDALSCYRAGNGLPSFSVQWGPWAEIGMSSKEKETAPQFAKLGLCLMPPDEAILALEASLSRGRPLSLLADVDWKTSQTFVDFLCLPRSSASFPARMRPRVREAKTPGRKCAMLTL